MWILEGIRGNTKKYNLMPNKEYIVGRKDCQILLANDASISRRHALIRIQNKVSSPDLCDIVLTDISKYGSFVNGKKLSSRTDVKLNPNDEILFGQCQERYRLTAHAFVIAMSCINKKELKSNIKDIVQKLGGIIVNEWNKDCTHLIMEEVTFTVKTVSALASARPIVTPKYLEDCLECCEQLSTPLPNPKAYFPKLVEPSLKGKEELFQPDEERRHVFRDKNFIFLSKRQHKRLSVSIELAGGTMNVYETKEDDVMQRMFSNDSLFLAPESKDESAFSHEQCRWIKTVMERLKLMNLRPIKESEIGLAILNVSLEKYCNPMSSSDNSIAGTTNSQIMQETLADFASQWHPTFKDKPTVKGKPEREIILAPDSQFDLDKKRKRSAETSMYIPETLQQDDVTSPIQFPKRLRKNASDDYDNDDDKVTKLQEFHHAVEKTSLEQRKSKSSSTEIDSRSEKRLENAVSFTTSRPVMSAEIKREVVEEDLFNNDENPFNFEEDINVANTEECINLGQKKSPESNVNTDTSRVLESQHIAPSIVDVSRRIDKVKVEVESEVSATDEDIQDFFEDQENKSFEKSLVQMDGYLNSKMFRPKVEADSMELNEFVSASTVVQYASLVQRQTGVRVTSSVTDRNVKNFKKFRKAYYPGQEVSAQNIIGSGDLFIFESQDENREMEFADIRAVNEEEERRDKYIDDLFKFPLEIEMRLEAVIRSTKCATGGRGPQKCLDKPIIKRLNNPLSNQINLPVASRELSSKRINQLVSWTVSQLQPGLNETRKLGPLSATVNSVNMTRLNSRRRRKKSPFGQAKATNPLSPVVSSSCVVPGGLWLHLPPILWFGYNNHGKL
eukprot:gene18765-20656_t